MPVPPYYDWIAHHAHRRPKQLAINDLQTHRTSPTPICIAAPTGSTGWLAAQGIGKGDRVALLAPNCPEYFELQFACGRLGAIMLPLNWRLTVPELEYILGDATPKLLIHDKSFAQQAQALSQETCSRSIRETPTAPMSARWPRARRSGAGAADARRHRHDHVHLGHHRAPEGRDHHPRHGVLERRQSRHPGDDLAADRAARDPAAVPYRRAQLLRQSGAACRRHDPDHARLRARPGARLHLRPSARHHPLLRRAGALPVHDAAPEVPERRSLAPAGSRASAARPARSPSSKAGRRAAWR